MGAVYKARDIELDRVIALKVIRPELASNPEILQRFKQELILARQVTDRNVIRIFDLGEADGIKYITMEYLEGETLAHRLLKGALPAGQVLQYGIEIADALDRAHRHGIIHRDLKPGNIMMQPNGEPVLVDFGTARGFTSTEKTLNSGGYIVGTPIYMSPEQFNGHIVDGRSDIFSALRISWRQDFLSMAPSSSSRLRDRSMQVVREMPRESMAGSSGRRAGLWRML